MRSPTTPQPPQGGSGPAGPSLTLAQLSNTGRQISLQFSQDVALTGIQLSGVFEAATVTALGPASVIYQTASAANTLIIDLDLRATIDVGDPMMILGNSSVVSAVSGVAAQPGEFNLQASAGSY